MLDGGLLPGRRAIDLQGSRLPGLSALLDDSSLILWWESKSQKFVTCHPSSFA